MASREVQKAWTGKSGVALLRQTLDFVRITALNFSHLTGRSLNDARLLDFGCGYGRVARLMYHFTDERNVVGVDPLEKSIALCQEAGLEKGFYLSDYLPTQLPIGNEKFDLIYAFSVFTHLSERAVRISLNTLRKQVRENGLLAITIRPIEYWQFASHVNASTARLLEQVHRSTGFAFCPHAVDPTDGDLTYGDTSISLSWLAKACEESWRIETVDRSLNDRLQTYLFLRPVN
jgi:SAM-dependent methyltransferase